MNLKQAKIILEKVNRLYESMTLDEKHIDTFEQDLMLSYIRQLYGAFSSEEQKLEKGSKKTAPVITPLPDIPTAKKEVPPPPKKTSPPPPPAPKAEEAPKPKVEEKEKVVPDVAVKPEPTPAPKKEPVAQPSNGDHDALFEQKEAKELSEKLSQAPIRDLTKAMGLNEKIFTINELFGGEKEVFNEAMKTLNGFDNFNEAKRYLSRHIADKYNWSHKDKKNKAKNLIKLIRRRYV